MRLALIINPLSRYPLDIISSPKKQAVVLILKLILSNLSIGNNYFNINEGSDQRGYQKEKHPEK
jgi:hypothetical protein